MSHPCNGCPEAVTEHPKLAAPYELWCKMFDEPKMMNDMCSNDNSHSHGKPKHGGGCGCNH